MSNFVEISHDGIVRQTLDAVLVDLGDKNKWIPRSQVGEFDDDTIEVAEWFAIKEGLV